jgi:hypothetical protein
MNTSTPGGVTDALSKNEEMGSIGAVEKASKDGVEVTRSCMLTDAISHGGCKDKRRGEVKRNLKNLKLLFRDGTQGQV